MWIGDPKPILDIIYKYYFSRTYIGSRNTRKGLKYFKNVYSILHERIGDIKKGHLVTKYEMYNEEIPEEILSKDLQKEVIESIQSMHLYNELRMNDDIMDFIPVVSKILVVRNGKIKNVYHGENKLAPNHDELNEFKVKYFGTEPRTVHAEVDAMYKLWRKFKDSNCPDCDIIIITVRNGHNVLSRPCKFCRGMFDKIFNEIKFRRILLIYPVIDDLVMIEEYHPRSQKIKA